ncbi:hypothetical protein JCM6882_001478 [Rhodosporidiobolus microsporus]
MSSTSPSNGRQSSRLTLDNLPIEVKQRIVELCAEQDERFRKWHKWAVKNGRAAPATKKGKSTQSNGMCGRSVGALFRVSKKFSVLAAPHLFKELKASAMNIHFKFAVSESRFPLFSSLDLDSADINVLSDLVAVLPKLSGLRFITIRDVAHRKLWLNKPFTPGSDAVPSSRAEYATAAFARLAHVVRVRLLLYQLSSSIPFLQVWSSSLRNVNVQIAAHRLASSDELATALSAIVHLDRLKLKIVDDDQSGVVSNLDPLLQRLTSHPPLRALSISANFLHSSHLSFAAHFAPSLKRLSLSSVIHHDADGTTVPITQPHFATEVFPSVTYLSLTGHCHYVHDTLTSIERRHFPALVTFSLELHNDGMDTAAIDSLRWRIPRGPNPLTLVVPGLETFTEERLTKLRRDCDEAGLELVGGAPVNCQPSFSSTFAPNLPKDDETMGLRKSSLAETLSFAQEQLAEAVEAEDWTSVGQLEEALRPLEYKKLAAAAWRKV